MDMRSTEPSSRDVAAARGGVPPPKPRLSVRAVVFVALAIALGGGIAGRSVVDVLARPVAPEWIALLVLTALAGWATLRVPAMPISFSISDTFSIVAALLIGPSAGALTAALDGLVLSFRMKRSPRFIHRVLFNIASPVIATWTAAQLFFALAGPTVLDSGAMGALRLLALVTVFGCTNFGLNTGMVAVAVAFERHEPILATWREHFSRLWVTHLGGAFAAMLMLVLSGSGGGPPGRELGAIEVLILIAPLPVILYVTFRQAIGRASDQIIQLERMNRVYVGAIEALAQAIDAKDQVTHDHIRRVQRDAVRLARALDVDDEMEVQAIKAAALLHDVGKLGVPEHILNKPGRLNAAEFEIMKRHAPMGADILSMIGFPYPVVPIVRHHHENWDGTGYPDGIAGERIPIGARILSVVDCFDALTSDRPYRPRLENAAAFDILAERMGTMYDPRVVQAFFALHAADGDTVPAAQGQRTDALVSSQHTAVPVAPRMDGGASASRDLELAFQLGRSLPPDLSPAALGAAVWAHIAPHVPAAAFVLFAYDEGTDALVPAWSAGDVTVAPAVRIPLGERLSGWVAASRQAIFNSDARLDLDAGVRDDTLLRSALAVPIELDGRIGGVLTFYSRAPEGFSERHLQIAHALACIVAIWQRQAACCRSSRPAA
jgi:putative nucleotidyltransferase with HDIG domain